MNLKQKRAAALKAAQEIITKAKADGRAMTDDERSQIEAKTAEIESLDAQIKASAESDSLMSRIEGMGGGESDGPDRGGQAKSIGEHFVKSLGSRSLKEPGSFVAPEFKAATDTQANGTIYGPILTDVDRSFVLPYRPQLVVADLLGVGTVSGNAVTYPVFGPLEGGSEFIAEGGAKPQMHVADPTWVTDALGEVAGWFKVTDDMAEDLPFVVSEIEGTARYDLLNKEQAALLGGNGAAPNLRGILNRVGIQTETQDIAPDSSQDAIFRAITNVQTATGFSADGIVMNPADYQKLRLSRDANGQYFGGGFFTGQYGNGSVLENPPLWGLRTVVTAAITAGTVLVGAFQAGAKVYRKGGLRVESTNSHVDDFTNDKVTIRLKERIGLAVRYPSAFVKVTVL